MVYIAKFVSRVKKGKQVSGERDEKIERKILNSIQSSWKDYNLDHVKRAILLISDSI